MPTVSNVYVALLAAGASRRFGSPKQLYEWQGIPLVQHAVNRASDACGDRVLLVLGHRWRAVKAAVPDVPFITLNERHDRGMSTSISAAARTLRCVADAIIVMPVDQPLVAADHLRALVDAWSGGPDEIVASHYSGIGGTPALFAAGAYDQLVSLDRDGGARALFSDERYRVQSVACEAAAFDIDSPDDLEQRSQFTQPESPST